MQVKITFCPLTKVLTLIGEKKLNLDVRSKTLLIVLICCTCSDINCSKVFKKRSCFLGQILGFSTTAVMLRELQHKRTEARIN